MGIGEITVVWIEIYTLVIKTMVPEEGAEMGIGGGWKGYEV
jgi:hypothetical protein